MKLALLIINVMWLYNLIINKLKTDLLGHPLKGNEAS